MDKEAQKRVYKIVRQHTVGHQYAEKCTQEITKAYEELGYHKIEGEPPLLSDEERVDIIDRNSYHGIKIQTKLIAQAQREADIKWIST